MNGRVWRGSFVALAVASACGGSSANDGSASTSMATTGAGAGAVSTTAGSGGGASSATGTGTGGGGGGAVPIFVAQGDAGRTTISCDDGRTWVGNHSWDVDADPLMCGMAQTAVCYMTDCSYEVNGACEAHQCCNDTPDVAKGVVFGAGQFVATWGWGLPGAVRRSTNGIDWTTTHPNDTFGGIAYGGGRFVVASRSPLWSPDGTTWNDAGTANFLNSDGSPMWSVRRFAYADYQGESRYVAVASGDTNRDMLVSSDAQTWWRPSALPDSCANEVSTYGGIVAGNGIIVIVDESANACRSTDGGQTWSVVPTGLTQILSHGVWTGSEFWFWGDDGYRVSSPDGVAWTKTPMTTPKRIGPVARSDAGTLVAVGNVWDGYDSQTFLRSTDGLTWEELPSGAFVGSHPIFYITFGYGDPSAACPLK